MQHICCNISCNFFAAICLEAPSNIVTCTIPCCAMHQPSFPKHHLSLHNTWSIIVQCTKFIIAESPIHYCAKCHPSWYNALSIIAQCLADNIQFIIVQYLVYCCTILSPSLHILSSLLYNAPLVIAQSTIDCCQFAPSIIAQCTSQHNQNIIHHCWLLCTKCHPLLCKVPFIVVQCLVNHWNALLMIVAQCSVNCCTMLGQPLYNAQSIIVQYSAS